MKLSERFDSWLGWLTSASHNLRSFAVLRVLYGLGLLITLVPSIPERSLLWGAASFWVDPEAKRRGFFTFDTLFPKDNPLVFDIVFFLLIVLVVLFTIGYRTRLVTVLVLVLVFALQANNPYVLNGGDTIYRITLLFLIFANLGAHYSVDAWLAMRRASRRGIRRRLVPAYLANAAHNAALVLCCFQIIIIYVVSGIWKLSGDEWLGGTALFYSLRIDAFMLYPAFNELLWQSSLVIYIATFVALWVQTLFPIALLWRPSRIFVLVSLVLMHAGIGILLGLWPFSLVMIALDMLFIRDSTWVSVTGWLRSTKLGALIEEKVAERAPAPEVN
ncbi:HTTM domain-containing protein [Microbacterium sp. A93]|uniref:HTTM domain-containing protein n=1 Tax=Microbacterium sp. A93 TaxID=3450716 RepID=UPI003F443F11